MTETPKAEALAPQVLEARRTLCRASKDKLIEVVSALPEDLRTDAVMVELRLAIVWQTVHALVGADIGNIDAVRSVCGIAIHDGIRTNAKLREVAAAAGAGHNGSVQ